MANLPLGSWDSIGKHIHSLPRNSRVSGRGLGAVASAQRVSLIAQEALYLQATDWEPICPSHCGALSQRPIQPLLFFFFFLVENKSLCLNSLTPSQKSHFTMRSLACLGLSPWLQEQVGRLSLLHPSLWTPDGPGCLFYSLRGNCWILLRHRAGPQPLGLLRGPQVLLSEAQLQPPDLATMPLPEHS